MTLSGSSTTEQREATFGDLPAHLEQHGALFLDQVAGMRPRLHRFCTRMRGSVLDGEDIVQEVLIQAFYKLPSLRDVTRLRPWLFRIAHNKCIDHIRQRRGVDLTLEDEDSVDLRASEHPQTRVRVREAFATLVTSLPPKERACVVLKDVLDYPLSDIAEIVGSTTGGVKGRSTGGSSRLGGYAIKGDVEDATQWPHLFDGLNADVFIATSSVELDQLRITGLSLADSKDSDLKIEDESKFHVVFGHRPDFALGNVRGDLLIAGHTHGGQVRLPFFGPVTDASAIPRAWAAGATDLGDGRTLIVSRGIGMERRRAPRMRFLCRPELVLIELVPSSQACCDEAPEYGPFHAGPTI